jgi:site-specific DNA-methyltransferase (adenine-specific)
MKMEMMEMELHHADCLAPGVGMEGALRPGSVDMVLCDPPFGVTSRNKWDVQLDAKELFRQLEIVTKPDAVVVFFSQGMYTADLMTGPWRKHWRYNMVWKQDKPRGFLNANHRPLTYHADIVVFSRERGVYNPQMTPAVGSKPLPRMKRAKTGTNYGRGEGGESKRAGATDRHPSSILDFPVVSSTGKNRLHPTQKPVELCEYLIRTFSNPGDTVLDFCAGSATTGEAAQRCGRRFIGFERDAVFHARAMGRLGKRKERDEEGTQ